MAYDKLDRRRAADVRGMADTGGRWVMLGAVLWASGCGPVVRDLRVEVRDAATKQPAAGVNVFADVPSNDHPFSIATLLGQTGPLNWRAMTDELGVAKLRYAQGRPVRVGVLSAGWAVGVVMLERVDDSGGAWVVPADEQAAGTRVPEFRSADVGVVAR
jgi:hypothetical protein